MASRDGAERGFIWIMDVAASSRAGLGGVQAGGRLAVATDGQQRLADGSKQESIVGTDPKHLEALIPTLNQVFDARGHQAAVFAGSTNDVFQFKNLFGHPRSLPMASVPGCRREIGRTKKEDIGSVHLAHRLDVRNGLDVLDDGHDHHMVVGLRGVLGQALPPGGGPFPSDAAAAFGGIMGILDGFLQFFYSGNPGDDHPIGSDVEGAFGKRGAAFLEPDEDDCVAAYGGPNVLVDFLPVEVSMFGVDHDPVHSEGDGDFGDAGRFERDPKAVNRLVAREFGSESFEGA